MEMGSFKGQFTNILPTEPAVSCFLLIIHCMATHSRENGREVRFFL